MSVVSSALFRVLQGAHRRPDGLGIVGQHPGVQFIGLGQLAGGLGKVAQDFGVHDNHGQARLRQGVSHRILIAPGGFQDHDLGAKLPETAHQRNDALVRVCHREVGAGGQHGNVQALGRDIDADKGLRRFHVP